MGRKKIDVDEDRCCFLAFDKYDTDRVRQCVSKLKTKADRLCRRHRYIMVTDIQAGGELEVEQTKLKMLIKKDPSLGINISDYFFPAPNVRSHSPPSRGAPEAEPQPSPKKKKKSPLEPVPNDEEESSSDQPKYKGHIETPKFNIQNDGPTYNEKLLLKEIEKINLADQEPQPKSKPEQKIKKEPKVKKEPKPKPKPKIAEREDEGEPEGKPSEPEASEEDEPEVQRPLSEYEKTMLDLREDMKSALFGGVLTLIEASETIVSRYTPVNITGTTKSIVGMPREKLRNLIFAAAQEKGPSWMHTFEDMSPSRLLLGIIGIHALSAWRVNFLTPPLEKGSTEKLNPKIKV